MKKLLFIAALGSFWGCREKQVTCVAIGEQLKGWTVYNHNDTIHFQDEDGNDTTFIMSGYDERPTYEVKEYGGLLKKHQECNSHQRISDGSDFLTIYIESRSNATNGGVRNPDEFTCHVSAGNANANFFVIKTGGVENTSTSDPATSLKSHYTAGNHTYDEVLVYEHDTTDVNFTPNVYHLVYAKNTGLVQFSTISPLKTWTKP